MTKITIDKALIERALDVMNTYAGKAEHRRTRTDDCKAEESIEALRKAMAEPAGAQQPAIMPRGESAAAQLRAMATNYPAGHLWDKLDAKVCIRGALEIEALRASHGQALRLLTQKEKDSLGRRAEGMDGNEWDQWVQEKFAQVNGLKVQGGSYE